MSLEGAKVALFVADLFEDLEFWYPRIRLMEEGADVTVIGPEAETYQGKHGLVATADEAISSVSASDFDALVIPGGYSPDHMRRHAAMVFFVKDMHEQGKVVAAICHGGWMLASAEILEGRKVTSFFSIKDDLVHAGATWVDQEVVEDKGIITSRNPGDLPAFCRTLIGALERQHSEAGVWV
jgi:protease I